MVTGPGRRENPERIKSFFDRIAPRYDFLNSWLSFGLDGNWRRCSCELVLERGQERILDLGAGTGKWIRCFLNRRKWDIAAGLDFSAPMLRFARESGSAGVRWICADFTRLPFAPASFDLVISAFTLRSVPDLKSFFDGVHGVLRQNGKAAFLCLTRPAARSGGGTGFLELFHFLYLRFYLTLMGRVVSGCGDAYRFLSDTVLHFQGPEETAALMRERGFREVSVYRFSRGIAALIVGRK
jgi:demethylmenaquinone methyltransferase/2-methoxy-6-polyprenyl-1,4-benzoquinol methylase